MLALDPPVTPGFNLGVDTVLGLTQVPQRPP